jgi:hypothetical protein
VAKAREAPVLVARAVGAVRMMEAGASAEWAQEEAQGPGQALQPELQPGQGLRPGQELQPEMVEAPERPGVRQALAVTARATTLFVHVCSPPAASPRRGMPAVSNER